MKTPPLFRFMRNLTIVHFLSVFGRYISASLLKAISHIYYQNIPEHIFFKFIFVDVFNSSLIYLWCKIEIKNSAYFHTYETFALCVCALYLHLFINGAFNRNKKLRLFSHLLSVFGR